VADAAALERRPGGEQIVQRGLRPAVGERDAPAGVLDRGDVEAVVAHGLAGGDGRPRRVAVAELELRERRGGRCPPDVALPAVLLLRERVPDVGEHVAQPPLVQRDGRLAVGGGGEQQQRAPALGVLERRFEDAASDDELVGPHQREAEEARRQRVGDDALAGDGVLDGVRRQRAHLGRVGAAPGGEGRLDRGQRGRAMQPPALELGLDPGQPAGTVGARRLLEDRAGELGRELVAEGVAGLQELERSLDRRGGPGEVGAQEAHAGEGRQRLPLEPENLYAAGERIALRAASPSTRRQYGPIYRAFGDWLRAQTVLRRTRSRSGTKPPNRQTRSGRC
jgi:hypothetical protein